MVTINTTDDLLHALAENPRWKEAVRREILTEELTNLPARFDRFVATTEAFMEEQRQVNANTADFISEQQQVNANTAEFIAEQRQVNANTAEFIAEQRQVNADTADFITEQRQVNAEQRETNTRMEGHITRIDQAMHRIREDTGTMKAYYARTNTAREAPGIALAMGYKLVRTLTYSDLLDLELAGGDTSDLSLGDRQSFRRADLVMEVAADDETTHYVALEISYTADERDTSRALRNAGLLTRFTGHPAHAAIASVRNVYEIQSLLDSGQVHWYELDDRAPPRED